MSGEQRGLGEWGTQPSIFLLPKSPFGEDVARSRKELGGQVVMTRKEGRSPRYLGDLVATGEGEAWRRLGEEGSEEALGGGQQI